MNNAIFEPRIAPKAVSTSSRRACLCREGRQLATLFIVSLAVCGTSLADSGKRGVLIVPEKIYDFGSAAQGEKVTHEFEFKNTGNADLSVQRMVPSCGCTAVFATDNTIKAGESIKIRAEFDTSGFTGSKTKTIDVFTSDLDSPQVSLVVKGTVLPSVTIDPPRLDYGEVVPTKNEESLHKTFSIQLASGSDLKIADAKVFSKYLTVERVETSEKSATFSVAIDPLMPRGPMRERVVVELQGGKRPSMLTVPIVGYVRGAVRVSPLTISVGIIEGKTPIERIAKIENMSKGTLKILGISSTSDAVKATFNEVQSGQEYVVKVVVDPTKVKTDLRASIEIETDLPDEEKVTLNVFGVVPPALARSK